MTATPATDGTATPGTAMPGTARTADGTPPAGRYGRTAGPRRRRTARAGLIVLAVLGVALVVWLGLGAAGAPVRWTEVGYRVDGPTQVELTFDVTKDAEATAVCRVQALSARHAEVGVQTVTVGPAGTRTQRVTTTIPTAEEAVTAIISTCTPTCPLPAPRPLPPLSPSSLSLLPLPLPPDPHPHGAAVPPRSVVSSLQGAETHDLAHKPPTSRTNLRTHARGPGRRDGGGG